MSQEEANAKALERCKEKKVRGGKCEMFAVGNKLVFKSVDEGTLELIRKDIFKE